MIHVDPWERQCICFFQIKANKTSLLLCILYFWDNFFLENHMTLWLDAKNWWQFEIILNLQSKWLFSWWQLSLLYSVINILYSHCSGAIIGKTANDPLLPSFLSEKIRSCLLKRSGIASTLGFRHLDILDATGSCSH